MNIPYHPFLTNENLLDSISFFFPLLPLTKTLPAPSPPFPTKENKKLKNSNKKVFFLKKKHPSLHSEPNQINQEIVIPRIY